MYMNIFVLDNDPKKCAEAHCDKHVVKMILEHAQLMCTAHHMQPNTTMQYDIPYKQTHTNHPCAVWVRQSLDNYRWLYSMSDYLNDEYKRRFNHDVNHKSFDVINNLPEPALNDVGITDRPRAMPDKYKIGNDIVASYRAYYINDKYELLKYKNTEKPSWLSEGL